MLFAIATVVACQKEDSVVDSPELSNDVMLLNEVDLNERFESFNSLIAGMDIPKGSASSARGGDIGPNWIEVTWFTHTDGSRYVYLRPEDLGNGCYPDAADEETYTLLSGNRLNIQVESGSSTTSNTFALPASLVSRYNGAFGGTSASVFNAQAAANRVVFGAIPSITVAFECTTQAPSIWEEDSATRGLFVHADLGSYRITDAPFPLRGKLATVMSKTNQSSVVLNYAGSEEGPVRTAIEADFSN